MNANPHRDTTRKRPQGSTSAADRDILRVRIKMLMLQAMQHLAPTRLAMTVARWAGRPNATRDAAETERAAEEAMDLAADLLLFAPSFSGTTAIDRVGRHLAPDDTLGKAAHEALRQARFRLIRIGRRRASSIVTAQDMVSQEMLDIVDSSMPKITENLVCAVRTAPLGDGTHALIGATSPLDDAGSAFAMDLMGPGGKAANNPHRAAEAIHGYVIRHGRVRIEGLNDFPDDEDEDEDPAVSELEETARAWASLPRDSAPSSTSIQRVRDFTSVESIIGALAWAVITRKDDRRLADAYTRIAALQIETADLRERNGSRVLTRAVIADAIDTAIGMSAIPTAVRSLFEELAQRARPGNPSTTSGQPDLDRVLARIQALRSKTVDQGCTEQEALAAAAKVAELLDRYGLSLDAVALRAQACEGIGIDTGRLRMAPIDDCVMAIAAFVDCRAWCERHKGAPIRHVFFGLRADVTAAHYLYDLIADVSATETAGFARGRIYAGLVGGERRSATTSFQAGLARGISEKLRSLRAQREKTLAASSGRDLVPIKASIVDTELERLGLHFRADSRSVRRRIVTDAYAAGQHAGSRFEPHQKLAKAS